MKVKFDKEFNQWKQNFMLIMKTIRRRKMGHGRQDILKPCLIQEVSNGNGPLLDGMDGVQIMISTDGAFGCTPNHRIHKVGCFF